MNFAATAWTEKRLRRTIRSSLEAWSRYALPKGMKPAAHHLRIIAELEKLTRGEITRLMLLLPPGSAKSTYASRLFPAWWLAHHPGTSVIAACHTESLAVHFGRAVRGLLQDHGARLGVSVLPDARSAGRFLTDSGGEYFAVGVHGAVTGRRADLALIDDPVRSFMEAGSLAARDKLWEWFRSELVTRLKPHGRIVLIMTRWHIDDLAGRLIAQGDWTVISLPALAEPGDPLGRAPGEALWPAWEDEQALLAKRTLLGERHFAALFQQKPLTDMGRLFNPSRLNVVDHVPEGTAVRAWDMAGSDGLLGNPDWTAGVKLVRDSAGHVYIDDVVRFRGSPADVMRRIQAVAGMDGRHVRIGVPQDPGQAGKSQVMFMGQMMAGYKLEATPETGSKIRRAEPVATLMETGAMSMRRAHWNAAFTDELANFPQSNKDDQVDALSRAFGMLIRTTTPANFTQLGFVGR